MRRLLAAIVLSVSVFGIAMSIFNGLETFLTLDLYYFKVMAWQFISLMRTLLCLQVFISDIYLITARLSRKYSDFSRIVSNF